ncbi:hypothetical protein F441_01599 [Phytophthora nicotianae CJ01A1]|uniref:DUF7869 domain-containing protein n=1 Tax=Phytophthora nicotianae CJ01A1 TaxID=1317063 RepID=W2XS39_PHYNI|nr:hypothetical protein F441_01599 [Phytophthora nicotianae CJ01A1]
MEDLIAYASGTAHRADTGAPVAAPVAPREPEEEVGCSSQSAASDSEKLDDSEDEDFTPDSQASSYDEEPLTAESADSGEEDTAAEGDEDIGIYLMDQDLRGQVTSILQADACGNRCVESKTKQLELLLCSLSTMTNTEKSISLYTLLGALMQVPVDRARGYGLRDKFAYYLPFVGKVCRPTFARCYGVVPLTVQRYKNHVRDGNIGAKSHGNTLNQNAAAVDLVWLVKWFKEFAEEVGEVVPVRVRMQKTKDGVTKKYYSSDRYTLLPTHFTWNVLYEEMHSFVEQIRLRVREPAPSTMRKLLTLHCPTIRIWLPRSNVCDICSIYHTSMRNDVSAEKTEALGRHTESARKMRREYKKDKTSVSDDHAVVVMDFSQNLTVPSIASTPSQWYFCSLLSVSCFGIFCENDGIQTNYLYDETASGKGSDQINSMLEHFLRTKVLSEGKNRLTVYADNCSGQNKNNYVIKFLLAQVDMGLLKHVDYKFFVKGHTRNSCDRGFGHIRKHVAKVDCYTVAQVVDAVKEAAANSVTVHIPRGSSQFKSYKGVLTELYKRLEGIQQYQIFSMDEVSIEVVSCRKEPNDEPVEMNLRRKFDGILTTKEKVVKMMSDHVEVLAPPPPNVEKSQTMYHNIRPYVPEEFRDDPLYAKPSAQDHLDAKAAKQTRRDHRAAMVVAAKANQDRRGREDVGPSAEEVPAKKRKAPKK